jgi:hypothetical protein
VDKEDRRALAVEVCVERVLVRAVRRAERSSMVVTEVVLAVDVVTGEALVMFKGLMGAI